MVKYHKSILLYIFLFYAITLCADDSLQSLYKANFRALKTKDTAAIVKSYKYLGNYLDELNETEKCQQAFAKGLLLAQKANLQNDIGIINNLLGNIASVNGNRVAALSHYHKALKAFATTKNLDKVAMALMNIGTEYESMGNYKTAIAYELKALKNKEASGEIKNLAYYYQHVGQLFKETDLKKWKYYVDKAYAITLQSDNASVPTKAAIFNDLGGIAEDLKNNNEAYQWYDSMYVLSKANEYDNGMATALSNRSLLLQSDKRYEEALKNVLEALAIAKESERSYAIITDNIHASSILLDMNRAAEAKKYALDALKIALEKKTYPEQEADAHRILAKINAKLGDWKNAYFHTQNYREGLDSIRNTEVQKSVQDLELKYQTSEKEKEIARLDSENKLNNLQLQRAQILIVSIVIVVFLIGLLAFVLYRRKQLKFDKQQAELKQKLLRSQMNPHFMFNTLNAINQYIQTNKGHEASDYLAQYSRLMRQILENSAVEFVSLETELEFLHNYLAMQQLRFDKSFEYTIEVADNINPESYEIPPMIAQPFIENAIEHGVRGINDGQINIIFSSKNKKLTLQISDNGKGFSSTSNNIKHKSFALDITRERLNITGNNTEKLEISSPNPQTGKGTLVYIEVPFKRYEE
jgi:tetratricopeptide (TPR) repeat protein